MAPDDHPIQQNAEKIKADSEITTFTAPDHDDPTQNIDAKILHNSPPASHPDPPTPPQGQDQDPSALPKSEYPQVQEGPPYTIHSNRSKKLIVLFASISAFFSPLTAQIYLPALPIIASDFGVTSSQINLTVTTYMIFQGITPMIIGGFADTAGRRPAYLLCFVIYIAANIGLALCTNFGSLLAVRCIQSAGSSTTIALCQAVVADIITSAERGQYIGLTAIPVVLAPSLGPVIGGVLTQYLGWRWIFWILAIAAGVNLGFLLFFFPETCRTIMGDGSQRAHPIYRTFWTMGNDWLSGRRRRREREAGLERRTSSAADSQRELVKFRLTPPNLVGSLVLLFEKELGTLLLYSGVVFSGFYATATAMPSQFSELYGLTDTQVGLMYLPLAGGTIVSAFVVGGLTNRNYGRYAAKLGISIDKTREMDLSEFPIERARLELGIPLLTISTCVTISWGWAIEYHAHIAVPCVLLFLMGIGLVGFSNVVNVLIVDIHPKKAGSAVAANNLTRCLLGAVSSAAIVPMINAWGAGWSFTFIGGLFLVFSPSMWLVMRKGMQWRGEVKEKEERHESKKEKRRRESERSSE